MERYKEIVAAFQDNPPSFDPAFWETKDGFVIAADWAEGFYDAKHRTLRSVFAICAKQLVGGIFALFEAEVDIKQAPVRRRRARQLPASLAEPGILYQPIAASAPGLLTPSLRRRLCTCSFKVPLSNATSAIRPSAGWGRLRTNMFSPSDQPHASPAAEFTNGDRPGVCRRPLCPQAHPRALFPASDVG